MKTSMTCLLNLVCITLASTALAEPSTLLCKEKTGAYPRTGLRVSATESRIEVLSKSSFWSKYETKGEIKISKQFSQNGLDSYFGKGLALYVNGPSSGTALFYGSNAESEIVEMTCKH